MNSWLRPRVSVKMSSSAPDTNSGGQPRKPWTTPSLNSTGSGTQIPSHQRNLHTHPQTIPLVAPSILDHFSWTVATTITPRLRPTRQIPEEVGNFAEMGRPLLPPNSVVVGTSTPRTESDLTATAPTKRHTLRIAFLFANLRVDGTYSCGMGQS
uniref:(northern house mosquito) hypothetical protein n=1 Tax=Culex pipiens TaxID=7175 RepID=A0A8D8ARS7_CULPI